MPKAYTCCMSNSILAQVLMRLTEQQLEHVLCYVLTNFEELLTCGAPAETTNTYSGDSQCNTRE